MGDECVLLGWKHSGFNVHRSKRVQPHQKEDLERLAQYIIRNPFPDYDAEQVVAYANGFAFVLASPSAF